MIVRFEDVITRVTGNVDRYNTDLEYYVGGDQYDSSALTIERRGNLKKDVDILGFKFHFPFKSGDVLLMARNPHLRKAGQVFFDGLCSDASYILRTKNPEVLLQDYIPILLQRDHFWDFFESHKTGGITFLMNWGMLKTYEFDLPPIEKQREVMEKVWAAYRLKQSYQKLIEATDEMVKSRFIEMFGIAPSVTIGSVFETTSGGTPSSKKTEYYDGGTIPWLTSGEVAKGKISDTAGRITELGLSNSSAKWVPANTVVIAMYGATVGKVGLLTIPCTTNQAICCVLPKEGVNPLFLYHAIKNKETWMSEQAVGAAQPNISQAVIKKMAIPMPNKEHQDLFVQFAEQADKSKFELKQAIEKIDKVMRALMQ